MPAQLAGERGVIPEPEQLGADAVDQNGVGAANAGIAPPEDRASESRRRPCGGGVDQDHVGGLDLEDVGDALGEGLERCDVRGALRRASPACRCLRALR